MNASVCPRCHGPRSGSDTAAYCPRCAGRLLLDTDRASDAVGESPGSRNSFRLGEYELGAELGRGAMGAVYRARQPRLKRDVAVKVILASRFAGEAARKRFLAEAELAAHLDHPNIVPIYEVGETPAGPFYAMKLVEGGTLAEAISRSADFQSAVSPVSNRQTPDRETPARTAHAPQAGNTAIQQAGSLRYDLRHIAALLAKIARAVHHAHQRGVLHRDLKPGNILLDAQGEPYVTDFGLAKQFVVPALAGADAAEPAKAGTTNDTLTGAILGTPAYMPPEQARGEKGISTAADVWSLGAILYHLLAGRPPFAGDTAMEVLRKVMEEEPAPPGRFTNDDLRFASRSNEAPKLENRKSKTVISADLETICLKCLEKDPARRYASALALAEDLERWLKHEPIRARPTSSGERLVKWARRRPAIAALSAVAMLLLASGLLGITWQWRRAESHAEESRQRLVRMATTSGFRRVDERDLLGALPWFVEALRLQNSALRTPRSAFDQSLLASAAAKKETPHRIRFATTLRQAPRLVQMWFPDGEIRQADFSPDGHRVAIVAGRTAIVWDVLTGQAVTPPLAHTRTVTGALFSPDSQRIATVSRDGTARIWDAHTGQALTPPMLHQKDEELGIAFSPDGNRLLTRGKTVRVWDARTGTALATEIRHGSAIEMAHFTPDGLRIWAASSGTARFWDAVTGKASSPAIKPGSDARFVAPSPNADRVLVTRLGAAEILDATSGALMTPPLRHDRHVHHPAFSPDGARIVTTTFEGTVRLWDAATGQESVPPIRLSENAQHAAFSPDGRWVVTAIEDHSARVWDATRGTPLFPPLWHGHVVTRAVFSPDGRCVLTTSKDGFVRVWDLTSGDSGTIVLAGEGPLRGASFAHDGRRLLTREKDGMIRVWDPTTGAAVGKPILPPANRQLSAALSPDGTRVATESDDGAIRVWEVATGKLLRKLGRSGDGRSVAWRLDGGAVVGTEARIWNPATGEAITPPMLHTHYANHTAFSPDGRFVATASTDQTARVWDARTGQAVTPPLKHAGTVMRVWFSPDGRRVASASYDGTARLWNATTGEQLTPPLRHGGWVTDVAFSPNGQCIVTTSEDGTARLWDAASGRPRSAPLSMRGSVSHPSFSRDGRMLLVGNGYYTQLWDVESGIALSPPLNTVHVGGFDAVFSPDERGVLGITVDRRSQNIDITPIDWPLEDLAATARLLSCREIDATGAPVPLEQMMEGDSSALATGSSETARTNEANDDIRTTNAVLSSQASDGPSSARALLRRDWERLKPRLSSQSGVSNLQSQIAWHTEQAAAAEVSQQWFAAAFHLDRLSAIRTNDIELRQHRDRVRERRFGAIDRNAGENARLSASHRVPPRAPATPSPLIDLTPHYTFALTDSLHISNPDNSFSALTAGMTNLAGVDFDVRGIVHLAGTASVSSPLPESVRGVRVGLKAARLHFLHACSRGADDTHIASLVVHYTNALHTEIPIVIGRDVRDWHTRANEPTNGANATVAWRGTNAESLKNGHYIRLFKTTWTNPIPGVEILSLDYVSKLTESAPFLIAITAE